MAAETASIPVNGNYAAHQPHAGGEQQNNHTHPAANSTQPPANSTTPAEISKDEVGWYFVEQYYTTLSRNPEKLYLFYNKRSQFVSGQETDKVRVYGGQAAINNRIKELDFKDCKVRVTNVDAQASDSNIVIQVIGEMSNKSQPHRKFAQTFVLATQVNGYFVLNDIFRYLIDEEEEEVDAEASVPVEEVQQVAAAESGLLDPPSTAAEPEHKTLTSSTDPVAIERDAQEVDKEIEEKVLTPSKSGEVVPSAVNGVAEAEPAAQHAEDAPAAAVLPEATQLTREEPEKPVEPAPTPSPPKQATLQPAAVSAPKPSAPKTWASMAASAHRVATPASPSATTSNASQARPTPPSTKTSSSPTTTAPVAAAPPTAPAAQREEATSAESSQGDEWTAVGGSHARQQSRQVNSQQQEGPQTRAYIKNVHEGIEGNELKAHLEKYGEVVYFDLSRQKVGGSECP